MERAEWMTDLKDEVVTGLNAPASEIYQILISEFPIKAIQNDEQHTQALGMTERLINFCHKHEADKSVSLQDVYGYLDTLTALIELYEKKRFQITKTNPSEMLHYLMKQHDLKQSDLEEELGGQSVVSEILRGKRELNIRQIRGLSKRFNVSATVFI